MVADAYDVLKEPRKRQRYDRALANGEEWRDLKDFNFGGGGAYAPADPLQMRHGASTASGVQVHNNTH